MSEDNEKVRVAVCLVRIESKIDAMLANVNDHEQRLRELEKKPVVTTRSMWAGLVAVAAIVSTVAPFFAQLYRR